MLKLNVNGVEREVDCAPETPLLWALRNHLGMTGTKFGCGLAQCGACTVHIDGAAMRSCVFPVSAVAGKKVRTIEDLGTEGPGKGGLSALQRAWIKHQVPQCGYCQSGMLMAASALIAAKPNPSDEDIDAGIDNICRCGTYQRIRAAIKDAAREMAGRPSPAAVSSSPAVQAASASPAATAASATPAASTVPVAASASAGGTK